jgi:hypothetical protein
MSSITVNVNANTVSVEEIRPTIATDDAIRAAAKKRFEQEEAAKVKALTEAERNEKMREETIKSLALEEQIRARVQEEQIRRSAEKAIFEAEARKTAIEKEAAIAAEVERLRNRSKQEIMEDTIAELKEQVASLKTKKCESCFSKNTIEKRFDITTIKPEDLGFNFLNCNNCGSNGCGLEIDYTIKEKDYKVTYWFSWGAENGRILYHGMYYNGAWRSIEMNLLYNGPVEKVLVKRASFECSKPFNVKGSIPGGYLCGQYKNNVKELIQTAFDRIIASS